MRVIAVVFFLFGVAVSYAQSPKVPHKMKFLDMPIVIRDGALHEIQKDVDALTKNPYYFNIKVERARTYFPLIEKIFKEEKLPDDFKFLVLQESGLISDAVSSSNAVGFWQFKDFTAKEVGMRVDDDIDERMNLASSTRGAARYLIRNNTHFDNWLHALQAYLMGAGGAQRALGKKAHYGAKRMEINRKTHWYVKKCIAHKIAFQNAVRQKKAPKIKMNFYEVDTKTSLEQIAAELSTDLEEIKLYNKWVKSGTIPGDKKYTLLIPTKSDISSTSNEVLEVASKEDTPKSTPLSHSIVIRENLMVNGVPVIRAQSGDKLASLASRAGIKLTSFLKYNDVFTDHDVVPGSLYFVGRKKTRAEEPFYKTAAGESLWKISQHNGVRLKKLMQYNLLKADAYIPSGSVVWLNNSKPQEDDDALPEQVIELDRKNAFDWGEMMVRVSSGS